MRIPKSSRQRLRIRRGDRVLLVFDPPAARMTVYPPASFDTLIAAAHRRITSPARGARASEDTAPGREGVAIASVDARGRMSCAGIVETLGWDHDTPLGIEESDGVLLITADPGGTHTIGSQTRFRLPIAWQVRFSVCRADRILMIADTANDRVALFPPILLDDLITTVPPPDGHTPTERVGRIGALPSGWTAAGKGPATPDPDRLDQQTQQDRQPSCHRNTSTFLNESRNTDTGDNHPRGRGRPQSVATPAR